MKSTMKGKEDEMNGYTVAGLIRRQVFLKNKGKSIVDLKAESQVETNGVHL